MLDRYFFNFPSNQVRLYSIIISIFALINVIILLPDFLDLYGEYAYISPSINSQFIENFHPTFYNFTTIGTFIGVSANIIILSLLSIYFLSLIFVLWNYQKFIFSIVALFIHVIMVNTSYFFSYGADYFITFSLFLNIFFCFSHKKYAPSVHSFGLRLAQIQLCIVYFFAGFGKLLGTDWFDGNAVWYIMRNYSSDYINNNIFKNTHLFLLLSVVTVFIEFFYFTFINIKYTRKMTFYAIVLLHINIALFMKLYTFGLVMILLNFIAWNTYLSLTLPKFLLHGLRINRHSLLDKTEENFK